VRNPGSARRSPIPTIVPFVVAVGLAATACVTRRVQPPIYRGPARASSLECAGRVLEGAGYRLGAPEDDTTAVMGELRRASPAGEPLVHVIAARLAGPEDDRRLEVTPRTFLDDGEGEELGESRPTPEEIRTAAAYVAAVCTRDEP